MPAAPLPAHQLVFPDLKSATNMPFFDGEVLTFCQSTQELKVTFPNSGTIFKRMRSNKILAARFKDIPRFSEISYRPWKLAYCNWKDKIIHAVPTGLPSGVIERSPTFYREGSKVHLSFISGVPTNIGTPLMKDK